MSRRLRGFVVSLIISFLLWVFVHLSGQFTVRVPFQVKLINIPHKNALWQSSDSIIEVELHGKGFSLINYYYSHLHTPLLEVNFSSIYIRLKDNKLMGFLPTNKLQSLIQRFLPESVSILSASPDTLKFNFASLEPASFAIKPNISVSCKEGFMVCGPIRVSPANIEVYVLSNEARSVKFIATERIEINDASDSIIISAVLQQPSELTFARFKRDSIKINIPIAPAIEGTIETTRSIGQGEKAKQITFNIELQYPSTMSIKSIEELIRIKTSQTKDSLIFSVNAPEWLIIKDFNPKSISNE